MRVLPPVEERIRREIRDIRARDPLISATALKDKLEKSLGRSFSHNYVARLSEKVAREALIEIDRAQIEERISFTRENYRKTREELLKIVYWTPDDHLQGMPKPLARDRVEAAKTVAMLDLALLKAEIECGLYKKPIEMLAKEIHYDPLPDDVRVVVIQSWRNFGLLPEATIQEMVPEQ